MTEIETIHQNLMNATCPEDVFGSITTTTGLRRLFLLLAKPVHPDTHPGETLAKDSFQMLSDMRTLADARLKDGSYGKRIPAPNREPIVLAGRTVGRKPVFGDIADVYKGNGFVIKVSRNPDDNDLMRAERQMLRRLKLPEILKPAVPILQDHFTVPGAGGWKREASVFNRFTDFVRADRVRDHAFVDGRTAVWMFKRLLVLLEHVHPCGVVHGAILPPHVLFYPDNDRGGDRKDPRKHALRLVGWGCAVEYQKRTRLSAWVPSWKDHYPPEITAKSGLGPGSDIFMAAMLIKYLLGDNKLEWRLAGVLNRCLAVDMAKRYSSAAEAYDDWVGAAQLAYGPPEWVDLNLPPNLGE